MSRELDEACARAMEWAYTPRFPGDAAGYWTTDGIAHAIVDGRMTVISEELPGFSSDPTATRMLEDEIERRGLIKQYVAAMWSAIGQAGHNGEGPNIWKEEWALIRATPEQKAVAFLEAIK